MIERRSGLVTAKRARTLAGTRPLLEVGAVGEALTCRRQRSLGETFVGLGQRELPWSTPFEDGSGQLERASRNASDPGQL